MMRFTIILGLCIASAFADEGTFNQNTDWSKAKSIYEFHVNDISGKDTSLDKYKDKTVIVVNVASNCGLTHTNYKQLEGLYQKYKDQGLRVAAFPSNQFAGQEPGTSEEIMAFAKNIGATFDIFEKVDVNGENAIPLYKWMKTQDKGKGTMTDEIKWNFTKFIIDKNGQVVERFAPTTEPFSMEDTLKKYL